MGAKNIIIDSCEVCGNKHLDEVLDFMKNNNINKGER